MRTLLRASFMFTAIFRQPQPVQLMKSLAGGAPVLLRERAWAAEPNEPAARLGRIGGALLALGPVGMQAIFRGADDHPESVDVVGLAFRINYSDAGQALLGPFAGEAKRIGRSVRLGAHERTLQPRLVTCDFERHGYPA